MQDEEALVISPIFKGLTRPATIMGVEYNYFLINFIGVVLVFINTGSVLSALLFFPFHAIGWVLFKYDPYIFRLLSIRASIGTTKNARLWRCQSYEAY